MQVFHHYADLPPTFRGGVLALGNFDGVHRGHQAIIGTARRLANERHVPWGVMTFEPHPRALFRPDDPPFRLASPATKRRLMEETGVETLLMQHFDFEFAAQTASEFVRSVLAKALGASAVVVGFNFVFGRARQGTTDTLKAEGRRQGIDVYCLPPVESPDGQAYSSTAARQAIRAGKMDVAAAILGRPWEVEGRVEPGDQRGRKLGFPTANMRLYDHLRPATGVYAIRALIGDEGGPGRPGVANFGFRPTFGLVEERLETHLFDFADDIYDRPLRVAFVEHLREERRFDGIDALKAQIDLDCQVARSLLGRKSDEPTS